MLGRKVYKKRLSHYHQLKNGLDSWVYFWSFARHFNNGLSIVASKSLIQNIGFGKYATHTKKGFDPVRNLDIDFPLKNNLVMIADKKYDSAIHSNLSIFSRVKNKFIRFGIKCFV